MAIDMKDVSFGAWRDAPQQVAENQQVQLTPQQAQSYTSGNPGASYGGGSAGSYGGGGNGGAVQGQLSQAEVARLQQQEMLRRQQQAQQQVPQQNSQSMLSQYQQQMQASMKQYQDQVNALKASDAQKVEQARVERETKKAGMLGNFKKQYEAALTGQVADLDSAKAQSIADLEKSYSDAVKNGDMSVLQAKNAFDAQKKQLEQQQYNASQSRNLISSQRGIGNSQQLLGMQSTDQAQFNELQAGATTARDTQLADIKSRLDAIGNTKNTETARIGEQYNASLNKAKSSADQAYQSTVNNLDVNDYNADRAFSEQMMAANRQMDLGSMNAQMGQMNQLSQGMFQADLQSRNNSEQLQNAIQLANNGNMNQLGLLAKQNGYDMEKMAAANGYDMQKLQSSQEFQQMMGQIQQGYTQQNMGLQQGYNQQNAAQQQGYTQDNMGLQNGYTQSNMGLQQGYTQDNMGLQQGYTRDNMAQQQGYTQSNMGLQQGYTIDNMRIKDGYDRAAQSSSQANQLEMIKQKAVLDRDNALKDSEAEYQQALKREAAKYTPGSAEYDVMTKQMKSAEETRKRDIIQKFANEAEVSSVTTDPYLTQALADMKQFGKIAPPSENTLNPLTGNFWAGIAGFPYPTKQGKDDARKKQEAYDRYIKLTNGG